MSRVTGIVKKVSENNKNPKFGTMYSVLLDNDNWYGFGKARPPGEGSNISFEATTDGKYWKADAKTVEVVKAAAPPEVVSAGPSLLPSAQKFKDKDDAKQLSISRQAASNTAVNWLTLLATVGALDQLLPKTSKSKAEVMQALLEKYRDNFFGYSQGTKVAPKTDPVDGATEVKDDEPWED